MDEVMTLRMTIDEVQRLDCCWVVYPKMRVTSFSHLLDTILLLQFGRTVSICFLLLWTALEHWAMLVKKWDVTLILFFWKVNFEQNRSNLCDKKKYWRCTFRCRSHCNHWRIVVVIKICNRPSPEWHPKAFRIRSRGVPGLLNIVSGMTLSDKVTFKLLISWSNLATWAGSGDLRSNTIWPWIAKPKQKNKANRNIFCFSAQLNPLLYLQSVVED